MTDGPEPRSALGARFDAACVVAFALAWLLALMALVRGAGLAPAGLALAGLAIPGVLAADLAAGLFHWFADTFFTPRTPVIGATLIRSFRDHHTWPRAIAESSAVVASGQNCLACVGLLGLALLFDPASLVGCLVLAFLLVLTAGIAATNLFHRWAHAESVGPGIARLQRAGWILSPERHALHHSGRHDRAYCVTTGWLNPWLDAVGFFPRLERAIRRLVPRAAPPPRVRPGDGLR